MVDYGVLSLGSSEISHRRFMVSAGMGFDAAVCCAASASRLRGIMGRLGLGKLFCFLLGLCQAAGCRSSRGYILLDGVKKWNLIISCLYPVTFSHQREAVLFLLPEQTEATAG